MRLVDADFACKGCIRYRSSLSCEECVVKDAPTVDAVPVVRCRECDHKTHDGNGRLYCLQLEMYLNKELDFFCKYGERKEGDD